MIEEKTSADRVKSWQANVVIFLLVALIAVSSINAWNTQKPAAKWEYKIESVPDTGFENTMNMLGADGWEMVFARRASQGEGSKEFRYEMIFRRPAGAGKQSISIKGLP